MEAKGVADHALVQFVLAYDVVADEPRGAVRGDRSCVLDVREDDDVARVALGQEVLSCCSTDSTADAAAEQVGSADVQVQRPDAATIVEIEGGCVVRVVEFVQLDVPDRGLDRAR